MDMNEQMDQNAADFSQMPTAPTSPSQAALSSGQSEQPAGASKSVTKLQIALVVGAMLIALATFYYFLSRTPKTQYPPKMPPAAVPVK